MTALSLPRKLTRVDVATSAGHSGVIAFETGRYSFTYHEDHQVCLSMPYQARSFTSGEIMPIFEMNIPEGFIRRAISEKLQRYTKINDLLFLALQQDRGFCAPAGGAVEE